MKWLDGRTKSKYNTPMKWSVIWGLALAATAQAGVKEMQEALGEWQQQMAEYQAVLKLAPTDEARSELLPPSAEDVASKIWRAVSKKKADTGTYEFDEEWAAPAVIWLVQHPEAFAKIYESKPRELSYFAQQLLNSIQNKHYKSPLIAEACPKLAESTSDSVYKILEKVYTQNEDPTAKGCAALALSIMLSTPALASTEGGYARTRSKRIYYILQALNVAPGNAMFGGATLTQVAEEQIYRLRHLSTGSITPRLKLTDAKEGKPVLFPREGKANLIFFWSPEEEVGLNMMRKQRTLPKQYPGLELCPIIPYGEREEIARILQENQIEICYTDDEQGTAGLDYRVSQLPMAVLVDERAHILYIGYPDLQLQTALEAHFNGNGKQTPRGAAQPPAPAATTAPGRQTPPTRRNAPLR